MFRDILRFLWRRDSESTVCLIISISDYLSRKDLKQAADYLMAVLRNRETFATIGGKGGPTKTSSRDW